MKNAPTTFRLSPLTERLLDKLAAHEDTTRTAALERAIKEAAKRRKLLTQEETNEPTATQKNRGEK